MAGRVYKVLSDGTENFVFAIDVTAPQIWNQVGRFFDRAIAEGFAAGRIEEERSAPLLLPPPKSLRGGVSVPKGKRGGRPRGRPKGAAKRTTTKAAEPRERGAGNRDAVVAMIQRHVAENRGAFPRGSRISRETGIPIGTVFSVLGKLEDEGIIVRDGLNKRHWKSAPQRRKSRAGQDSKPAAAKQAAAPEAARSRAGDQAAIDAHIAAHGVTRVPPAALVPGTATLNSKFEHEPVIKAGAHVIRKRSNP